MPDRAKVIEAMARGVYESTMHAESCPWTATFETLRDSYRADARAALAALEAGGWGLTSTREGESCEDCGGSGEQVAYTLAADQVARDIHRTCPSCGGSGHATKGTGR